MPADLRTFRERAAFAAAKADRAAGDADRYTRMADAVIAELGGLDNPMADIEWQPLPAGLWTAPAVFAEVGHLLLQAFTDGGVPTWEIYKKTGEQGAWNIIVKGTADSFEAAKAAAVFEAEAASQGT